MRTALAWLCVVAAFALGAWVGWWMLALVALLWGFLRPALSRPILGAALAGMSGWGLWLLRDFAGDPAAFGLVARRVGAVLGIPGWALLLATLVFAALLAWSAAALGNGLMNRIAPRGS